MNRQAGRYYAKRPSAEPSSLVTEQSSQLLQPEQRSPISGRSATPFRELTEDEAMEMNAIVEDTEETRRRRR